ncbi:alpha/beta hydrolase [Poritiphilus flavus]|nr:alpha/beta hydrolase [Poritiphilus flavus]
MDFTNESILREIPISIWYPAQGEFSTASSMLVLDYMHILKEEEEWENLPDEHILNWFYYPNTETNQSHLEEKVKATLGANELAGSFPTVIYAPSYQASSIENFALCEYLASHGFIVVSSPSRGAETRFFEGGTANDMETQARDIEFLIKESLNLEHIDKNAIATMGFSFGGLSNVLAQARNGLIKANVSLDGSVRYQYPTLKKSPFFSIEKVNVPFIHMAQKLIPEQVMKEDKIDPSLNNDFIFFDELKESEAYSLRFNNLTHSYFSTLGVLFQARDLRQDKSDTEILESYRWMCRYTLMFLNAYLNKDVESKGFLRNEPAKNGVPSGIISVRSKQPAMKKVEFEDFNDMAAKRAYKDLEGLYESIQRENPGFVLEEGKLNTLGLQLVLQPDKANYGIEVFHLAVGIYPGSANLFDSLAEGYLLLGDNKNAIKYFEKSLQLNPENENAINRLGQLKGK